MMTIFVLILLLSSVADNYIHVCRNPQQPPRFSVRSLGLSYSLRSRQPYLRIGLQEGRALLFSPKYWDIKKKIINPALSFWSQALTARNPLTSKLLLDRSCLKNFRTFIKNSTGQTEIYCTNGCEPITLCGGQVVPEVLLDKCREVISGQEQTTGTAGSGVEHIDTLIFVDAKHTEHCSSGTLAYATVCQTEDLLNRPIAGSVNICPKSIQVDGPGLTISYYTILHELAHALGFNSFMYAFMRDQYGEPRTPRDPRTGQPILNNAGAFVPSTTTVGDATINWISITGQYRRAIKILKTPKIKELARKHFGCPSMDGAELENQGNGGTLGTHFEERLFYNELMTGVIDGVAPVSEMTLGFFEDSGKSEPWDWGANLGCTFCEKSCYEFAQYQSSRGLPTAPWCELLGVKDHSKANQSTMAACELSKYATDLDRIFRYFNQLPGYSYYDTRKTGGHLALADYCPISKDQLVQSSSASDCVAEGVLSTTFLFVMNTVHNML